MPPSDAGSRQSSRASYAVSDYEMQLALLDQQNRERLEKQGRPLNAILQQLPEIAGAKYQRQANVLEEIDIERLRLARQAAVPQNANSRQSPETPVPDYQVQLKLLEAQNRKRQSLYRPEIAHDGLGTNELPRLLEEHSKINSLQQSTESSIQRTLNGQYEMPQMQEQDMPVAAREEYFGEQNREAQSQAAQELGYLGDQQSSVTPSAQPVVVNRHGRRDQTRKVRKKSRTINTQSRQSLSRLEGDSGKGDRANVLYQDLHNQAYSSLPTTNHALQSYQTNHTLITQQNKIDQQLHERHDQGSGKLSIAQQNIGFQGRLNAPPTQPVIVEAQIEQDLGRTDGNNLVARAKKFTEQAAKMAQDAAAMARQAADMAREAAEMIERASRSITSIPQSPSNRTISGFSPSPIQGFHPNYSSGGPPVALNAATQSPGFSRYRQPNIKRPLDPDANEGQSTSSERRKHGRGLSYSSDPMPPPMAQPYHPHQAGQPVPGPLLSVLDFGPGQSGREEGVLGVQNVERDWSRWQQRDLPLIASGSMPSATPPESQGALQDYQMQLMLLEQVKKERAETQAQAQRGAGPL